MTVVRNTFDKRIKDFSDILSFKKYDDKYVGKTGYFSDSICRFQNLATCVKSTLTGIDKDVGAGDYIFETEYGNYRYFLPESLVKKEPKKIYRPFFLEEFLKTFKIGDVVTHRVKGSTINEYKMFTGYEAKADKSDNNEPGACDVTLGSYYGLQYLFDQHELFLNGKWQPFGIEIEEK